MQPLNSGILAGMPRATLQSMLTSAQQAYAELSMGKKGVSFSYTQGDGTRSVAYQPTSVEQLTQFIMQLQRALGQGSRRRTVRFRY
jgi:hypothetical protein